MLVDHACKTHATLLFPMKDAITYTVLRELVEVGLVNISRAVGRSSPTPIFPCLYHCIAGLSGHM